MVSDIFNNLNKIKSSIETAAIYLKNSSKLFNDSYAFSEDSSLIDQFKNADLSYQTFRQAINQITILKNILQRSLYVSIMQHGIINNKKDQYVADKIIKSIVIKHDEFNDSLIKTISRELVSSIMKKYTVSTPIITYLKSDNTYFISIFAASQNGRTVDGGEWIPYEEYKFLFSIQSYIIEDNLQNIPVENSDLDVSKMCIDNNLQNILTDLRNKVYRASYDSYKSKKAKYKIQDDYITFDL